MQSKQQGPTIQEIQKQWDTLGPIYQQNEATAVTFYISLINLMKISQAKNILEMAVGTARIIPYSIAIKSPQASYYGVDISQIMLNLAEKKLRKNFQLYDSKLSYQEWLQKNKIYMLKGNGQEFKIENKKFDRIICNMVVMLTQNPAKMLENLYSQAQEGCLIGVSVWGDRKINTFQNFLSDSVAEIGVQAPKTRSNHHLHNKISQLLQLTGWEVIVHWQQSSPAPYIATKDIQTYFNFAISRMKYLSQDQKKRVLQKALEKVQNQIKNQRPLNFPAQLVIARKKQKKY